MESKKVTALYYSPTHTSAKVCYGVASAINSKEFAVNDCEITYESEDDGLIFGSDDLVVVSVPVYCSRVAPVAVERLSKYRGNNTPAIALVTYGNRDYGDALLELCDILKNSGFKPIAAAAFIGEHSYSTAKMPTAEGRPDTSDIEVASYLGVKCREKLDSFENLADIPELTVKGNMPYFVVNHSEPTAPAVNDDLCVQCELCIDNCPAEAISYRDGSIFCSTDKCEKCCRCVKECPEGAMIFNTPYTEILHTNFALRREPEVFM